MWLNYIFIILLLTVLGLIELTLLAGLSGGVAVINGILAIGVIRMTAFSRQGIAFWIVAAALIAEIFSHAPLGLAASTVIVGLLSARFALFKIFNHHSFVSRAACAAIGITAGIFVSIFLRLGSGPDYLTLLNSGLLKIGWTTLFSILILLIVTPAERRFNWLFGKPKTTFSI